MPSPRKSWPDRSQKQDKSLRVPQKQRDKRRQVFSSAQPSPEQDWAADFVVPSPPESQFQHSLRANVSDPSSLDRSSPQKSGRLTDTAKIRDRSSPQLDAEGNSFSALGRLPDREPNGVTPLRVDSPGLTTFSRRSLNRSNPLDSRVQAHQPNGFHQVLTSPRVFRGSPRLLPQLSQTSLQTDEVVSSPSGASHDHDESPGSRAPQRAAHRMLESFLERDRISRNTASR